jgi:AcrR family transcriptional regulator
MGQLNRDRLAAFEPLSTRIGKAAIRRTMRALTAIVREKLTFSCIVVLVKAKGKKGTTRRRPVQVRAQVTVGAVLDAAIKILKREGSASLTTNRMAETAGVSIGSVYQYFPNKRAIYLALHERHITQVDAVMRRRMTEAADASLEQLIGSMIDGMIEAHMADPELSGLLQSEVPHRAEGSTDFSMRNHGLFRNALATHAREFGRKTNLDMRAFVVSNMIDSLGHAIVLRRPDGFSLSRARAELLRAVGAYLKG